MNKEEAKELEKAVENSKLAEAGISQPEQMKEQPLGFDFKKGGVVTLGREEYLTMVNVLKPFQYLGAILDVAKDKAVSTGNIIPFYESDVLEIQKNEHGQIVNYILKDTFGMSEPAKKDNSINLVDLKGGKLGSK